MLTFLRKISLWHFLSVHFFSVSFATLQYKQEYTSIPIYAPLAAIVTLIKPTQHFCIYAREMMWCWCFVPHTYILFMSYLSHVQASKVNIILRQRAATTPHFTPYRTIYIPWAASVFHCQVWSKWINIIYKLSILFYPSVHTVEACCGFNTLLPRIWGEFCLYFKLWFV